MPKLVVTGATLRCSEGLSSSALLVTSQSRALGSPGPAATVMDYAPLTNIVSFGLCDTESNPAVAAATAAASGTHTPAPCVPATTSPWSGGAQRTTLTGLPALTKDSTCQCIYGGQVSVADPGQTRIEGV